MNNFFRKLLSPKRLPVCPYCFDQVNLATTPFRCQAEDRLCPPEADPVFRRIWDDTEPKKKIIPPSATRRDSARCTFCSKESTRRLCPHCHMDLSRNFGEGENYIFSIIGAKEAGKSHYIAVLIDSLERVIAPKFGASFSFLDDLTDKRYKEDFRKPLFDRKRVLQPTQSAAGDFRVRLPMVYRLAFRKKSMFGLGEEKKGCVVTLVFFDTAGEDLNDQDRMNSINKYIYESDGIILLVDPLQLQAVRANLSNLVSLPSLNTETSDILNRTTRVILDGRRMKEIDMINTPLAVSFTKIDALAPILGPQSQLLSQSNHDKGYDLADFHAVDAEVRSLLQQWGEGHLENSVKTNYSTHGFFGLSALGSRPAPNGDISQLRPHRIADPMLWLLHQHGLIPASNQS